VIHFLFFGTNFDNVYSKVFFNTEHTLLFLSSHVLHMSFITPWIHIGPLLHVLQRIICIPCGQLLNDILFKDVMLFLNSMSINLVDVNNGKYTVSIIADDEYIGPNIAMGHEWDGWMRNDIKTYYKEGTDILDVGANIGYNTLMFSDYGPVSSFEPVFHQIVAKNVKQNPIKHPVNVYTCALSNEKKKMEIFIPSHGCQSNTQINYGGTSFHLEGDMKGMSMQVPCERLDDIYEGIPSVIKIDVEHHEMQVLEGAKETIQKHMPTLLIEIHDFDNNPVAKFLEDLGYDKPDERPEAVYLYKGKH